MAITAAGEKRGREFGVQSERKVEEKRHVVQPENGPFRFPHDKRESRWRGEQKESSAE